MQRKLLATAALAACALALPALAQQQQQPPQLTVVNFGGANANAQKKAFYEPYEKAGAGKVVAVEYNGEQAKIKAMVEAKKVTWDVVEVESPDAARGCDEGLFEKLDYSKIAPKADLLPAAVTDCAVGIFVWSTVMAYNGDKLKTPPTSWADFWDVKKIPGKRGSARARATTSSSRCWPTASSPPTCTRCWPPRTAPTARSGSSPSSSPASSGGRPAPRRRSSWWRATWR